jgi:hypothetical protein
MHGAGFVHPLFLQGSSFDIFRDREIPCVLRLMPWRAVVLRIEPPLASRPFGFHR